MTDRGVAVRYAAVLRIEFVCLRSDGPMKRNEDRRASSVTLVAPAAIAFVFVVALAAGGCAEVQNVPEGTGEVTEASEERLDKERDDARRDATMRAIEAARNHPEDLRMQRKAAALAISTLSSIQDEEDPETSVDELLEKLDPILTHLSEESEYVCKTRSEAAFVYEAADRHERAGDLYARSVESCDNLDAALEAAQAYREAEKCDKAIGVVEQAWPQAGKDHQVPLLDAVNRCSSAVNLEQNLPFVSDKVLSEYKKLLEERRERSQCISQCRAALSDCRYACATYACQDHCEARYHTCMSQCE